MTERLLRELAPQVLGALARRFRDFPAAEDAVQEALLAAATQWAAHGVPQNPRAWLFAVATRRVLDQRRSELARRRREEAMFDPEELVVAAPDGDDTPLEDDALLLLFMCCHPALTRPTAIALTLRAVGGLTTAEIASAFFVPEATMAQRISRAKQTLVASGLPFEMPSAAERDARLGAVLQVLYLVFNEGYASSSGPALARVDLSAEAIRLGRALHQIVPDEPEVAGLLALMLLTDARREARQGPAGELVPLDEQDRSRWNRAAIDEGTELVTRAMHAGAVGAYQIQAAIAALHDEAATADSTDWPQIALLYAELRQRSDNPMVALSHAVAEAMVHGPQHGLATVAALEHDARLHGSHRLDAVRGHLHERAGDHVAAQRHYLAAAARTASLPERNYLLERAARLRLE